MIGRPDVVALAARTLAAAPLAGAVRLVCIDGPSGSGKTTLAADLARHLDAAPVVHGDDVYEGWAVVAEEPDPVRAFAALGAQLVAQLVQPWSQGRPGEHRVWDWDAGAWGSRRSVPVAPAVVLEGVGLAGAALRPYASLVVWLDAEPGTRARRVADRDGPTVVAHMDRWRAWEALWHEADRTAEHADILLRTD